MLMFFQSESYAPWLAPYAYAIVFLGFGFFLYRVFENWYATKYDKPLFRNYLVYKRLNSSQEAILRNNFHFYGTLSKKHKQQFQHRVAHFISSKNFVGRNSLEITEEMTVLIAALGCMLSFGRRNYIYSLIEFILIYPDEFYSEANEEFNQREFNPREKTLVLSWNNFKKGVEINNYSNAGIQEFMLAMQLEAKQSHDLDSERFNKQFQNILKLLTDEDLKSRLEESKHFHAGFTNQFEFMGILTTYFFEAPEEFKSNFPKLYDYTKKLLNFDFLLNPAKENF